MICRHQKVEFVFRDAAFLTYVLTSHCNVMSISSSLFSRVSVIMFRPAMFGAVFVLVLDSDSMLHAGSRQHRGSRRCRVLR